MSDKMRIIETIVVEGRNDVQAVSRAVEANFIITSGFGVTEDILKQIRTAKETTGVVVLTDPDYMGERIREILNRKIPGLKHAYISRREGWDKGDIVVEIATPESIRKALMNAKLQHVDRQETGGQKSEDRLTAAELYGYGLSGAGGSDRLRELVAERLNLGSCNSKQFIHRVNTYGITRDELEDAIETVLKSEEKE